jgi:protease-4
VAQGRVWTGAQAKERGLVDTLGSYGDALKSAARRAKLPADYRVVYIERETSKFERFIDMIGGGTAQAVTQAVAKQLKLGAAVTTGLPPGAATGIVNDLGWLSEITASRKPFTAITHCLCESP